MIEQAEASATEICGLLLGTAERVEAMTATRNVAQDPARHFEVDPAALFAALRATRRGGPAILGHYHSHPRGSPDPSMTDAAQAAADGRLWLIVGGGTARLWRAVAQGSATAGSTGFALPSRSVATLKKAAKRCTWTGPGGR